MKLAARWAQVAASDAQGKEFGVRERTQNLTPDGSR
jgi:hypothetical protein